MPETAIVTLLFTDLVGSTALSQRVGEDEAEHLRQVHFGLLDEAIATHRGKKVKNLGDGLMVAFAGASDAVACGIAMQQAADRHNRRSREPFGLRIGLHAGEVTVQDADYFGTPVVIAERLCKAAAGGQILASEMVRALTGTRGGYVYSDAGALELKGIADLVPAVAVGWEPAPESPASPLPQGLGPVDRTGFVARREEREQLEQAFKLALGGARQVVLISGEPGIGKTRLATELAFTAHDIGATVLYGRCDEDLAVPYQPFAEALRDLVARCDEDMLAEHIASHGAEIGRLVPDVLRRAQVEVPSATASIDMAGDRDEERHRLLEAVSGLLCTASTRAPVVLLLDDLHWAARPTLVMLRHVLRRTLDHQVLLLGTYRDTDLNRTHPLAEMLADLRREPGTRRVSLSGLDVDGVRELMQTMAGEPLGDETMPLARALHDETEGNPFFVGEVLRHLAETGAIYRDDGRWTASASIEDIGIPEGVREVIGRRLTRLSENANRALSAAAVVGGDFELDVLENIPDAGEPDAVLEALEEAERAGLVQELGGEPGHYRFTHALVRQTLYDELSSARRARLHRRVGEAIERRHGTDVRRHLPALARHFAEAARAGDVRRASEYAIAAGRQAMDAVAYEEAAAHARRALQVLDLDDDPHNDHRAELHLMLGEALTWAGDMTAGATEVKRAADAARSAGLAEPLALAAFWYGNSMFVTDPDSSLDLCREALAALPPEEKRLRSRLLALTSGFGREAEGASAEAVRLARESGDSYSLALALFFRDGYIRATALTPETDVVDELIALGGQSGDRMWVAQGLRLRAIHRLIAGDRAGFERDADEFKTLASELRSSFLLGVALGRSQMLAALDGRFDDALRLIDEQMQVVNAPLIRVVSFARRSWILREQGDLAQARTIVASMHEAFPATTGWHASLVATDAALGDVAGATAGLDELARDDYAWRRTNQGISPLVYLAEASTLAGHSTHARRALEFLGPLTGQLAVIGDFLCTGAVDRYLAMLETVLGDLDAAERHFERAVDLETRIRGAPLLARTQYWYGRMLVQKGEADRARALFEASHASAETLGMKALADDAGRQL